MFNEEFPAALESLQNLLDDKLSERAEADGDVLASGRTLAESLELLHELSQTLDEIWKNDGFVRVPQPAKRSLIKYLGQVVQTVQQYAAGRQTAQEVEQRIDGLHNHLWQYNLIDRTDEVGSYERKNYQLEALKRKGRRIIREFDKATPKRDELLQIVESAKKQQQRIAALQSEAAEKNKQISERSTKTAEVLNDVEEKQTEVQRLEGQAAKAETRSRQAANEVDAIKAGIDKYHQEVDKYKKTLDDVVNKADSAVDHNTAATEEIVAENRRLEEEIRNQLQKATGASLFTAFHERRKVLSTAKWIWAAVSVVSLLFTLYWGVYLAENTDALDALFYIRVVATIPLLALVIFALQQYGRERKAEEAYAFKAALSLSLVPYKELIEKLGSDGRDERYAQFLVSTIGQIYQAPQVDQEDSPDRHSVSVRAIKELTNLIDKATG